MIKKEVIADRRRRFYGVIYKKCTVNIWNV